MDRQILEIFYIEDLGYWSLKTSKFSAYGALTIEYTYNKQPYDVYEFDFKAYTLPKGEYYITIDAERTLSSDVDQNKTISFKSEQLILDYEFEQTVDIMYWNNTNNDIYWNSGIYGFLTVALDTRVSTGENTNEVGHTDETTNLKDAIGREYFKFVFEPMTLEIMRKLSSALSQYNVVIDGTMYSFNDISHKAIDDYTNDYVVEAKGYKKNVNVSFISGFKVIDWSTIISFDTSITFDRKIINN